MRALCFYLPQYHPTAENDRWWGKGFTEWTNVAKARPLYRWHYQPHIPADLGFYDLRVPETRIAQASLARTYGIHGFCYYHYWFNGRMLLDRPFNEVLDSGKPDFPFCLCWANENWTRRWDGQDSEILIAQNYLEYDPSCHMDWLCRAFRDSRYIRVEGRPLFLVYNSPAIPDVKAVLESWRKSAHRNGIDDIFICSVKSFHNNLCDDELIGQGFDAIVDFHPNFRGYPKNRVVNFFSNKIPVFLNGVFASVGVFRSDLVRSVRIFDYRSVARSIMSRPMNDSYTLFPAVMPGWDNTPRRKSGGNIIQNDDAEMYKTWLLDACRRVRTYPPDRQIVFINAWNEWGEGCHLEPDLRNGHAFLKATREALDMMR